ncbi:MAG: glycerophosphodiester phosphodiesterase [Pseudorhodobacter sp.]
MGVLADLRGGPGLIRVHGHRGARGIWPENTLSGFALAFDMGLQVVELDVLVTVDGVAVVTHNPALKADCTRDASGRWLAVDGPLIAEMTLADLRSHDIGALRPGSDYGARYPEQAVAHGLRVPTLAEVCALISAPGRAGCILNLEIKSDPDQPDATPPIPDLVAAVLAPLRAAGVSHRVIVQSFDWRVVHEAARQAPEIPRSYLSLLRRPDRVMAANIYPGSHWMDGLQGASLPDLVAAAGGAVWCPHHSDLSAEDREDARRQGLIVNVWTVNEPDDIARMIDLGVDGIITDYPGRVQRALLDRGMVWRDDPVGCPAHIK